MITQTATSSFKLELASAVHDFTLDVFKIALYSSTATLGAATMAYSATGEVSGAGYTAAGATLTTIAPVIANNFAGIPTLVISFVDVSWPSSTLVARGALIYNSSKSNKAVAVLDFGADKTTSNATLTVSFPAADANSAVILLS